MDNQEQSLENSSQETQESKAEVTNDSDNQEALDTSAEESQPEAELDAIPEKFVGKSPLDIIKAYNNAERQLSKVSSERAEERKRREDLEKRVAESEERIRSLSQPVQQRQEEKAESDPFADYEKQFDTDPKEAIKSLVAKSREQSKRERELAVMQHEALQAQDYYQSQKRDNPEYAKLEPTMKALAQEYGDLVDPRKVNSVKALKLLHLAAQGMTREQFASEIASKAKKETSAVKQEKRAAFSESSNSKNSNSKRWEDLSVEEMEKLLPKA